MITSLQSSTPALKAGVTIRSISPELIALIPPRSGMEAALVLPATIRDIDIRALLRACDGRRKLPQLSSMSGLEIHELEELLTRLQTKSLINLTRTPIPYQSRYNAATQKIESVTDVELIPQDPAITAYLERFDIESKAMELHPGVIDAGRETILRRRDFSILIFGFNRIAFQLGALLIASGFANLRFINRRNPRDPLLRISNIDITGNVFRRSDFGLQKFSQFAELCEDFSLFGKDTLHSQQEMKNVDLVISTEPPTADQIQRWMNEETTHLPIIYEVGGMVRIGPLVKPGKTPCLRCVELTSSDGGESELVADREVPSSLVALVSGIVAADIANLSHSAQSVFWATTRRYSLRDYISPKEERWQSHPGCGCFWR